MKERVLSVDALRGFDMFFITGGSALIVGICSGFGCPDCWLATQMRHVPWAGFAHHDTIFPLFLFLAGVTWPFSLASQRERGRSAAQIHGKILARALTLFLLEICMGRLLQFDPEFRLMGVLSFIGICWGVAAVACMHLKSLARIVALIVVLLVGYWAVLRFGIAPDAPAGADSFSKEWNVVSYLDRTLWPTHLLAKGVYEPESLFSLPGGVSLALLGMCAGLWLRRTEHSPGRRCLGLFVAAFACLAGGAVFCLCGAQVVKALWTSPFVLFAAAYSLFALAVFYWAVDIRGWRRWCFCFQVIGLNSILIYMMMRLGILSTLGRFLSSGLAKWIGAPWAEAVSAAGMLAAGWLVLYALYRKKAFFSV